MAAKLAPEARFSAARIDTEAGGGAFEIAGLSIGVFLVDQPTHRIAVGGDRRRHAPMAAHEGWLLPAGASGACEYDHAHTFVLVEIDETVMRDVGFDPRRPFAPRFGAHDPLLLQMALTAAAPPAGAPQLYLQTMRQALAAHVAQLPQPPADAKTPIDDLRLRRAIAFIQDNLAADLSLEALAAEAAMSPFHFSRAFKKSTGLSPLQFVISERLSLAKILIETTRLPIAEIAHRVGYGDVSRFGQHFKRRYGATPASFR